MRTSLFCALLLLVPAAAHAQEKMGAAAARRFQRFESGVGRYRLEESLIGLADAARRPGALLLIRICSTEPMLKALPRSAAAPHIIYGYMEQFYDFPRERIQIKRSVGCGGGDGTFAPTELWVIPEGAEPPASVESITLNQFSGEVIKRGDKIKSVAELKTDLRRLIKMLRAQDGSVGVVEGTYYRNPSPSMQRALQEAKRVFAQSNLSASRYLINIKPWRDEVPDSASEPRYPSLYLMKLTSRER